MSLEHGPTPEVTSYWERIRKKRDAELVQGGAQYKGTGRLEVDKEQLTESKLEMMEDIPVQDMLRKMADMKEALDVFELNPKAGMDKAESAYAVIEYLLGRLSLEQKAAMERELYQSSFFHGSTFEEKVDVLRRRLESLKK